MPAGEARRLSVDPQPHHGSRRLEQVPIRQDEVRDPTRCDRPQLVLHAEDLRRVVGQGSQRFRARQTEGRREAGVEDQVARVVVVARPDRERHTRSREDCGVGVGRIVGVEARARHGQHGSDHDRHPGRGDSIDDLPGLVRAVEHRVELELFDQSQRVEDRLRVARVERHTPLPLGVGSQGGQTWVVTRSRDPGRFRSSDPLVVFDRRFEEVHQGGRSLSELSLVLQVSGVRERRRTHVQHVSIQEEQVLPRVALESDHRRLSTDGASPARSALSSGHASRPRHVDVCGLGVDRRRHAQVRLVATDLARVDRRSHGVDLTQPESRVERDHPGPEMLAGDVDLHHVRQIDRDATFTTNGDDPVPLDVDSAVLDHLETGVDRASGELGDGPSIFSVAHRPQARPRRLGSNPIGIEAEGVPPLELDLAVDEGQHDLGVDRQGVAVQQRQIGLLTDLDRSDQVVDPELDRRIDRHRSQRPDLVHAGITDGLGRFVVEVPHELRRVRLDSADDPSLVEQGSVARHRVVGLDLVGPPVREGRRRRSVSGDLVGDLVALQHVVQGPDAEAEVLRSTQQHQDLVGPVAVAVDDQLALHHLHEGVQANVTARRRRVLPTCSAGLVLRPLRAVLGSALEGTVVDRLHAEPSRREAYSRSAPVRTFGVLAQGELDPLRPALEAEHVRRALVALPPAQLQELRPAADRIRGAVHDLHHGRPTSECAVDPEVVRIDHVGHVDLGRDRDRALVDPAVDRHVRVGVDRAGREVVATGIEDVRTLRRGQVRTDRSDQAVDHEHVRHAGRPDRGVHGRTLDQDVSTGLERRLSQRVRRMDVPIGVGGVFTSGLVLGPDLERCERAEDEETTASGVSFDGVHHSSSPSSGFSHPYPSTKTQAVEASSSVRGFAVQSTRVASAPSTRRPTLPSTPSKRAGSLVRAARAVDSGKPRSTSPRTRSSRSAGPASSVPSAKGTPASARRSAPSRRDSQSTRRSSRTE